MDAVESKSLGALLRTYRQEAELTQEALAGKAGLSAKTISLIESDKQDAPRESTIARIMDALPLQGEDRALVKAAWRRHVRQARTTEVSPDVATVQTPLVGRSRELDLLDRHLDGHHSAPPVLLFAGEPGIGKTRLLDEAARRAEGLGLRVLRGRCQRGSDEMPYMPLLDALERYLDHLPTERARTVLTDCAWLVRLLPELAGGPIKPLPSLPVTPAEERRLMFKAVATVLDNVAGPAGTLLVLDDLQWAGADALELLLWALRAQRRTPLLVVGAYRDTELQPGGPLDVMLADLAAAGLVSHHALAPLSLPEASQMLDALVGDAARLDGTTWEWAVRRSGGVPFSVVSFAQTLAQSLEQGAATNIDDESVPWDVAQSLRGRVAALSDAARAVLATAAVVGRRAPVALLVAAMERPEDEVLDALEEATRARLLDADERGVHHFAHDVVRETVEAGLGAGRRVVLFRRVARALEEGDAAAAVEDLAYYYSRSDADDKAVFYLERAGLSAELQAAYMAAEGYYRALAERLNNMERAQDAAAANEKRGNALRLAGRFTEALVVFDEAAETYREADDLDSLVRAIAWIGHTHAERGTSDEGMVRVYSLLALVEAGGPRPSLAFLYSRLSFLLCVTGDYVLGLAAATRAADIAREIGDRGILGHAGGSRGAALMMLGRLDEALEALLEAAPLARDAGEFEALASILTNVATVHMWHGQFDLAWPAAEESIAVAERLDHVAQTVLLTLRRAFIGLFEGTWERARETVARTETLEPGLLGSWGIPYLLLTRGIVRLLEGDTEEGVRVLERSVDFTKASGDIGARRWAEMWLAEYDLREGHPREALDRLTPLLDRPDLQELDVTIMLPRLAWARLDLGEGEEAATKAEEGVNRAAAQGHLIALVDALWARALVASRRGRWAEAVGALRCGLRLARRLPYPYAEARLRQIYGLMHCARGKDEAARRQLAKALEIFQRLGAGDDAGRVERELARL